MKDKKASPTNTAPAAPSKPSPSPKAGLSSDFNRLSDSELALLKKAARSFREATERDYPHIKFAFPKD